MTSNLGELVEVLRQIQSLVLQGREAFDADPRQRWSITLLGPDTGRVDDVEQSSTHDDRAGRRSRPFEGSRFWGSGPNVDLLAPPWLNPYNAAAMAVETFRSRHPVTRVYDVSVQLLGPAPKVADGTVDVGRDIHDRFEF